MSRTKIGAEGRLRPWQRLQWALTISYVWVTVAVLGVVAAVSVAGLWYLFFRSALLPQVLASDIAADAPRLAAFLQVTPPDTAGLRAFLQPNADAVEEEKEQFTLTFRPSTVILITDARGAPRIGIPARAVLLPLTHLERMLIARALRGESDPSRLGARSTDGTAVAAVPILGAKAHVLGVLFERMFGPDSPNDFGWAMANFLTPFLVVVAAFAVLAGSGFGFLNARRWTRRLERMACAADAWSRGDFGVLVHDPSEDEMGRLGRHLNRMAQDVRRLLAVQQSYAILEERSRLARDLHDTVKQQVFANALQIEAALALLNTDPVAARARLADARQLALDAQQELTAVLQELRLPGQADRPFSVILQEHVADWSWRSGVGTDVDCDSLGPVSVAGQQALLRIVQESLINVARHSGATGVRVEAKRLIGDGWALTIIDNGRGLAEDATRGGMGLTAMHERMAVLPNGRLKVESVPGRGVRVQATWSDAPNPDNIEHERAQRHI